MINQIKTNHKIIFGDSKNIANVPSGSVNLMFTSPPYPMIEMWDEIFSKLNPEIGEALKGKDGMGAFELMHKELDQVWNEVYRVLKDGGIACINIGDAVRTIDKNFQLYSSHARILNHCLKMGFNNLPAIIWRKQTNAPNKFMGSGTLPAGAYVTLEHEFILLLRKGRKREFVSAADKLWRHKSAFFWEEWFSDVWFDLKGAAQKQNYDAERERSAAFPFELAYRIINMFSAKEDIVLDPFLGTGTTMLAAMASCRNSLGIEIDPSFKNTIFSQAKAIIPIANAYIRNRLQRHIEFVNNRIETKGDLKYVNKNYGFPVMTRQELEILFNDLIDVKQAEDNCLEVTYCETPQTEFISDWSDKKHVAKPKKEKKKIVGKKTDAQEYTKAGLFLNS